MICYQWSDEKNKLLKHTRGVSFEQVLMHVEKGDLLDVVAHPNQERYGGQRMLVVRIDDYVYLVPFVEKGEERFLKTIIPSRRATREYLEDI